MNEQTSKKLLLQTVGGKPVYNAGGWSYTTKSSYIDIYGTRKKRKRASTLVAQSSEGNLASNARRAAKCIGEECEWIDSGETEKFFQL